MKKSFLFLLVLLLSAAAMAQEIVVQHNTKGLYAVHTVAPKENFYSLGRLYAIPPRDIAAFNNLEMERGLSVGQVVNVPLTAANFSQEKTSALPVYYIVGQKEGLYRVSVNNNKVLMANLRKWNNLKTDAISTGQKLVVGYLLGSDGTAAVVAPPKKEEPARTPEPKKEDVVIVDTKAAEKKEAPEKKEPVEKKEVVEKKEPVVVRQPAGPVQDGAGGYFKTAFEQQAKSASARADQTATAGIFKTASGWQDAKYYALIDGIEPGTIIRVINPNNNKAIYAKVLDKMSGIRQNQGYNVRISNAAATALDVSETDKFFVRVNY